MDVLTKQLQIAELAAARPEESFTSLNHYLDMGWMKEAYRRTRRESAAGVDGKTMEQYGKELESNLQDLIGRAKSGRYHAPPVRRVHIPKGDGKETRPIGIPTTEDKVLQRAITMLLEPIYEQEFKEFSFGFRPGRSAHDCLQYLWKQCMTRKGGYAVKRKTAAKRMSRGLKAINQWLQSQLHLPIRDQWEKLKQKLHGHFAYYGITGNAEALERFRDTVKRLWHKWLNRRSGPL